VNREFNHLGKISDLFCLTLGQKLPGSDASGGAKSYTWMANRFAAVNFVHQSGQEETETISHIVANHRERETG